MFRGPYYSPIITTHPRHGQCTRLLCLASSYHDPTLIVIYAATASITIVKVAAQPCTVATACARQMAYFALCAYFDVLRSGPSPAPGREAFA